MPTKPKILYINALKADYLQDWLYAGLADRLGKKQIIDFPFNYRYHFPIKQYPKNGGYVGGLGISRFLNEKKSYDLVIVASSNTQAFNTFLSLKDSIPASCPVVFVDGGDRPEIAGDLIRQGHYHLYEEATKKRPFDLILKREYLIDKDYPQNTHPFPFCMNMNQIPNLLTKEKKYDVSFWGVESHPIRTKALKLIEDKFDCKKNGSTRNQVFKDYNRKGSFYLEELKRCKIVLNFRGGGWDTVRYWEVPAVASFMISQKPGIYIPNDFQDGVHIAHVKEDLSNLIDLCEYYLKNSKERERMAKKAHNHLLSHHTHIHRAEELLEMINKR